jgi:transcriptional regulator with XRE-family HTH domain
MPSARTPDPIDALVGRNIRLQRLAKRISQGELAKHLGITLQQVQKYERGANRVTAGRLVRLTDILEVSLTALFDGVSGPRASSGASPVDLIIDPRAFRLAQAYAQIGDAGLRSAIVALVEDIARRGRGSGCPDFAALNPGRRLSRRAQLDMHFLSEGARRVFDLVETRIVIEIEQAIDLRAVHAELARKVRFAGAGLDHCLIERELGSDDGRKRYHLLSALGCRWRGDILPVGNARLQHRRNSIGRPPERVSNVVSEGRGAWNVRHRHQQRAVGVFAEFHRIAQHGVIPLDRDLLKSAATNPYRSPCGLHAAEGPTCGHRVARSSDRLCQGETCTRVERGNVWLGRYSCGHDITVMLYCNRSVAAGPASPLLSPRLSG